MLGEPSERRPRRKRFEEFLRRVRPEVWEDYPILWRRMFVGKNSVVRGTLWMMLIVGIGMPFLMFVGFYDSTGIIIDRTLVAVHFFTSLSLVFVTIASWVASQEPVSREQLSQTWISILSTPISNARLVSELLLPSIVSAASTMILIFLVVVNLFLFRGIGLAGIVALPIVMATWLVMLASVGMMRIINSTPEERRSADVLVWTVGILIPVFVTLLVTLMTTFKVWDSCLGFDEDLVGMVMADSWTATGSSGVGKQRFQVSSPGGCFWECRHSSFMC